VRVLFDQGTPVPLKESLYEHDVSTTYERGWSTLSNGDLLDVAESEGFDVPVTTDKNLRYQQDLGITSWPRIRRRVPAVVRAINDAASGSYLEVPFSTTG
jgi:hypothetical protein